jgi:hypothetical protein
LGGMNVLSKDTWVRLTGVQSPPNSNLS